MKTYRVKMNVELEMQAFNSEDINDYINDIFSVDEEIKSINITSIKEK